jgi:hypothetical protein
MDLSPEGSANEVNPDGDGGLWISDLGAKEIWQ